MDAVADTKVTARSGAGEMIIRTGIEMIMETVFKRGEILGCAISVVKSAYGILPTPLDLMLLRSVILALSPFKLTTTIGILSGNTDGVTTGTGASDGGRASTTDQHRLSLYEVFYSHQGKTSNASSYSFLTDFSNILENLK